MGDHAQRPARLPVLSPRSPDTRALKSRSAPTTSAASCARPTLLEARDALQRAARSTPRQLRAVEDEAIRDVVRLQEDVGLHGITDGEFRRTFFHIDFLEQLDGVNARRASR